tara:strand:+ start:2991 stop:3224 length:234 start_codon:yes stop_codon:yes gene_type:complete
MTFSDGIKKFSSKATSKIESMQKGQQEKITAFLQEKLGDECKDITSIKFDNEAGKFYDIKATESVITKLREAGYLRD